MSRYNDTHMPIITTTNGAATMMVMVCRPLSASLPPAHSIRTATAPVLSPQKATAHRDGNNEPLCDKVPMTIEAASAPETKKIATSAMTNSDDTPASGR